MLLKAKDLPQILEAQPSEVAEVVITYKRVVSWVKDDEGKPFPVYGGAEARYLRASGFKLNASELLPSARA